MSGLPPVKIDNLDKIFMDECLSVIPKRLHKGLIDAHGQLYPNDRQGANLLLLNAREVQEKLAVIQTKYLSLSPSRKHSSVCADLITAEGIESGAKYCDYMGVGRPVFPKNETDEHQKNSQSSAIKRMTSSDWWERKLKIKQNRDKEARAISYGRVYRAGEVYTTDENVKRYANKQAESKEWIEASVLLSEELEEVNLSDVIGNTVANPYNRFAEYMVRVKGDEEIADRNPASYGIIKQLPNRMTFDREGGTRSDIALLDDLSREGEKMVKVVFTLTCPSRFHRYSKSGDAWHKNRKYDESTPKDAQAWLQETWTRVTREWERPDSTLNAYGYKVLEQHHAGTVHSHIAIYVQAHHIQPLIELFYVQALRGDDGNEAGALKRRLNWKIIATKGGMTSYMTKYISKGITGADFEDLESGKPSEQVLIRMLAHRSLWGLRQFAFYRSPSVMVWRELYRMPDDVEHDNPTIEKARKAVKAGDWSAYVDAQGGCFCKSTERPIKVLRVDKLDESGNPLLNQYGERIDQIRGVVCDTETVITRAKQWMLINVNAITRLLEGKYKSMGNPVADLGNELDALIQKSVDSKQLHKLAEYAGVQIFPPLDLFKISPQKVEHDHVF